MKTARAVVDPLWQCLCPSWTQRGLVRANLLLTRHQRPAAHCLNRPSPLQPRGPRLFSQTRHNALTKRPDTLDRAESTPKLYGRLSAAAINGKVEQCRQIAEYLVKERQEQPNIKLYNALILCNISDHQGTAWRVHELLDEMREEGIQPDIGTCHAVLKVLSIHLDHLLRADILEYMRKRWYPLSEDGAHDVAAALFREGLFEQALARMDEMRRDNMRIDVWLQDLAVFVLCDAGEIEEAYRIMLARDSAGEPNLSRDAWAYLLDKASALHHHAATAFAWRAQVGPGYLNPPSGVCLNVLTAASRAGDAALATDVFAHLAARGSAFLPVHYSLLIAAYLAAAPAPDLLRAISILTIMPLERRLAPGAPETRALFAHLRDDPTRVADALAHLRQLRAHGRAVPIAALNLLLECYVHQRDFAAALRLYKLIHTFAPSALDGGVAKSFADTETFNLLLKGCRLQSPPDAAQAAFLMDELQALRVEPDAKTYDRLVLVFLGAAGEASASASASVSGSIFTNNADATTTAGQNEPAARAEELLNTAYGYFEDMLARGLLPRFGTLEELAVQLAGVQDPRCWDVLQVAEDRGAEIEGFEQKAQWVRANVERAWDGVKRDVDAGPDVGGVAGDPAMVTTSSAAVATASSGAS